MDSEVETKPALEPHRIYEGSFCEALSYFFKIKKDEFDVAGFHLATGVVNETVQEHSITCAPENQESDYHLHIWWRAGKKVDLRVRFVKGPKKPDPDEKEPYAEQFMRWVEKFFTVKTPESHIHSEFRFPSAVRQSKFLLPLKAVFGPAETEVEIDGISFTLNPERQGITKIWLTKEPTILSVHLTAERQLDFKIFDPKNEIGAFAGVLDSILEEKK